MKRLLYILLVLWTLAGAALVAQVAFKAQTRSVPPIVLVEKTTPDTAQICAEPPDGGLVACRPIGEFRKWVRELPAKK